MPGDESALRQALAALYERPPTDDPAGLLASPMTLIFVALIDGQPVGFTLGYDLPRLDGDVGRFIYEVQTSSRHRRRGIGRAMLREVEAHARGCGVNKMWVLTHRSNRAANALYAAAGGRAENDDDVLYCWRFAPPRGESGPPEKHAGNA